MMDFGGIDADVANLLPISENAAYLDSVTVNDPDDLDYGWITLGCDRSGEQGEQ